MDRTDRRNFIRGIHERRMVLISFYSKEDKSDLTRKCVPFDYGASRIYSNNRPYYHSYDLESDAPAGPEHNLALEAKNIHRIVLLREEFDPSDYVHWSPSWHLDRDWDEYSNEEPDYSRYYEETKLTPLDVIPSVKTPSTTKTKAPKVEQPKQEVQQEPESLPTLEEMPEAIDEWVAPPTYGEDFIEPEEPHKDEQYVDEYEEI